MDVKCSQLMRCIICYANPILITNAKTQARKGLILYNKWNYCIKKHVYVDHCMTAKISYELVNDMLKEPYERKHAKKRPYVNGTTTFNIFVNKDSYKKYDV